MLQSPQLMGVNLEKKVFGVLPTGETVYRYTLQNAKGMCAELTDYGAKLLRLWVPDKSGIVDDVVLGYDTFEEYAAEEIFIGATVGPNANRIANASFKLDGITYQLDKNDGENNLHSSKKKGFQRKIWSAGQDGNKIVFSCECPDGEMGFPGNRKITVTYVLTEDNALEIHYYGTSDKKTVFNMTNHSYFNLGGHGSKPVYDEWLCLKASSYTPIAKGGIPTGEIIPVEGTPMDFTSPKRIGAEIDAAYEQLQLTGGYDHNFVIDNWDGTLRLIAVLEDRKTGRTMETYSDLPGVQIYTCNADEPFHGKDGWIYQPRQAVCLETQYYPNAVNEPAFPQPVYSPEQEYKTTTIYKFI